MICFTNIRITNSQSKLSLSPGRLHANNTKDLQCYPTMQAPLLNRRCQHKTAEEEEVGLDEVLGADFFGWENPQRREEADWKHRCDCQRQGLCAPKRGHQYHNIKAFSLLKEEQHTPYGQNNTQSNNLCFFFHFVCF